ncbi:MAG: 50S ribosomal protein L4 [Spirochaetales bacterium]|nr:50S ribosomal protein L4 [Spirochaetales bacterium]
MEKKVYSVQGKEIKTITLSDEVFAREISEGSIYNAIKNELANLRVGTADTKTRADVHGAHQKLWKQKGTGRARMGTKQSPVWVGGGVVFGPHPRDYSYAMPRKVKQLAMKSILSLKAATDGFKLVENFTVPTGKTADLVKILKNLVALKEKTVIILKDDDEFFKRAARNLPWLSFLTFNRLRAHDLFYTKNLLVMESAAVNLSGFYSSEKSEV